MHNYTVALAQSQIEVTLKNNYRINPNGEEQIR